MIGRLVGGKPSMYFILRVGRRTRKNSPPDRGVGNTADVLIKACAPSPMTSPLSWTREPDQERDLDPSDPHIHCPLCGWSPRKEDEWFCTCGCEWNTFDTGGVCPACLHQWTDTQCLSCARWSLHSQWYSG